VILARDKTIEVEKSATNNARDAQLGGKEGPETPIWQW
jgi:hypothetical protein